MGRLVEAVNDFTKAIELDSTNASSYNSRGLARDKLGARQEALADFTTAIGLDNNSAVFWHNRGYCLRNMYVHTRGLWTVRRHGGECCSILSYHTDRLCLCDQGRLRACD